MIKKVKNTVEGGSCWSFLRKRLAKNKSKNI